MNAADITKKTAKHDWRRVDALTDAEVHRAAMKDADARPLTDEEFARDPEGVSRLLKAKPRERRKAG